MKTGFWVKDKDEALKEGKERGMSVWKARGPAVAPGGWYFLGNRPSNTEWSCAGVPSEGVVWEEVKE